MNDSLKVKAGNVESLVKASRAGDKGAFGELVRIYQKRTMQLAFRILGNCDEAAEVVQESFVKAYLNIKKLRQPSRFEAWFFRIVTNIAISHRKMAKCRVKKINIVESRRRKKTLSPVQNQIAEELRQAIQDAMLKLSKKEVKAIALFGMEDLSQEKVARIMGCSVEVVRWNVFRARQKLKVLLKDYLE